MKVNGQELIAENENLKLQLEEYKTLIDSIRNGAVDALVIYKNGTPDIYTLESTDYVYRVLVENFAEGALNLNDKGLIVYANPAFGVLLGIKESTLLGTEISTLIDPGSRNEFDRMFTDSLAGNGRGEITLNVKDHKTQVYISMSSLAPKFSGVGVLITNLSERNQRAEELLNYKSKLSQKEEELLNVEIAQKSTEKFRVLAEILPQMVWTADANGETNYFNKKWTDYTGLSSAELQGWGWKKSIHPDNWKDTETKWQYSIDTGEPFEFEHRIRKHDESYKWFLSRGIPQMDADNKLMWVGTSTNIDDHKNFTHALEQRVNESTAFLRTVFNSTEELITSFDKELKCTSINRVAARNIQDVARNLIGRHIYEIYPMLNTEFHRGVILRALDGEMIHEREVTLVENNKGVYDTYFKPLIIDGQVSGMLVTARDITSIINVANNLRAAKEKLEEQFQSIKEKNNELTFANSELLSFTYVASHDLKEPLRKIQIFTRLILDKQGGEFSPATAEHFDRIISASKQMQNLIDALLSYSRVNNSPSDLVKSDLNLILKEVENELQDAIADSRAVITSEILPTLNVIPFQVGQLFSNLVGNSLKYCRNDRACNISISSKMVPSSEIISDKPLSQEHYWKISFADNGIGFEQKYEQKIFELFQRLHTRDSFEGTGIGLAICNKIVQNHNGVIQAIGREGEGSVFNIFLPVTK